MKKIGLVAAYNHNYGSLLQTYALQNYLYSVCIDNEIILYTKKDVFKQFCRLFNIPLLIMKVKTVYRDIYCKLFQRKLYKNLKIRDNKFEEFKLLHLSFSENFIGRKALIKGTKNYQAYILGSDQVWNPVNLGTDYCTLNFIPENVIKITYAPSFGVSKIPCYQIKRTQHYLNRINYISVREKTGQRIINELINREVPVVCDPTLLIDRDYWDKLKVGNRIIKDKYIFCYFLGSNPTHREFANRLKKNTGLIIVALQQLDEFVKKDLSFADLKPFDIGPAEFVNLISNAEFILTDSLHGTIFSILYRKIFFTFGRFMENKSESTNSRIDSIFEQLNLKNRKLTAQEDISDSLKMPIDYDDVYRRLNQFRELSKSYLLKALANVKEDN